jgi:tetratricopeptide (TPR) repeat protein
MEEYQRLLSSAELQGNRASMAATLGSLGELHADHGALDRALECFAHALESDTEPTDPALVSLWLRGAAETMLTLAVEEDTMPDFVLPLVSAVRPETWRIDLLRDARRLLADAIRHARTIDSDAALSAGTILLARIDAAEGKVERACSRLEELLAEDLAAEQCADLHYWLWRFGRSTGEDDEYAHEHAAEALRRYSELPLVAGSRERRLRIEELTAAA